MSIITTVIFLLFDSQYLRHHCFLVLKYRDRILTDLLRGHQLAGDYDKMQFPICS